MNLIIAGQLGMKHVVRLTRRVALGALVFCSVAPNCSSQVNSITAFVDGRSGPWDTSVNPTFGYGVSIGNVFDSHLGPTVISSALGLSFRVGEKLIVQWISGSPIAGNGGAAVGVGGDGVPGWAPVVPPCVTEPGCYTGVTTYLEQLLGVYADAGGVIVGTPFVLGSGPTTTVIPNGATALLLGFNDGWYNDNGSGITVRVTTTPEPQSVAMLAIGLLFVAAFTRKITRSDRA